MVLQPDVSITDKFNLTGVSYNEPSALTCRLSHFHANDGVSLSGVGADSQDTTGITNITDGVGHRPAAECCDQTGHRGGMSETGTVVNIIGAQYRPGKFLNDIVLLIGALS